MSHVAAGRRVAAALAAAALFLGHSKSGAQEADGFGELNQPLDPSAPLDPLPDLGVEWPDLEAEADDQIATAPDTQVAEAAGDRSYAVYIQGLSVENPADLTRRFVELSTLEANKDDPSNAAQIDRRAREDAELLAELLRSEGHYDAAVTTRVEAEATGPVRVVLEARPGPLYRFTEVRLPGIEAAGADQAALQAAFGVEANDPVKAEDVLAGEAALRVALGERGYAFADIGDADIAINHETRTATLVLPVNPEGARRFGRVIVEGAPLFSAAHIETISRFDEGEPYRAARIDDLRRALVATGLVSSVDIRPVPRAGTEYVDLAVALSPAPMRTIAAEAGYGTGEGIRVEASWQHRNLIRPEGAVTVRGIIGTREQLVSANLRQNNFGRRDRVLTAIVSAGHIERDAYEANTFQLGAGIERQSNIIWQKKWTWGLGGELIASDERDVDVETGTTRARTFFIGALPAFLSYDGSNDLLDPTEGFRVSGRFSPEASLQDGFFGYGKAQIDASAYRPVTPNVVLAGRVRLGTIFGESRDRIAPSRRFYSGGGGSVRGYGYQRLGPRDPIFDDPIGGRSLAEFSIEARVRTGLFDGALGIVPFLDAGNIYTSSVPDISDLRFGAGIGFRYHTNFGPIRVDLGTPLNRRSGDDRIAVYVSLGQAF